MISVCFVFNAVKLCVCAECVCVCVWCVCSFVYVHDCFTCLIDCTQEHDGTVTPQIKGKYCSNHYRIKI